MSCAAQILVDLDAELIGIIGQDLRSGGRGFVPAFGSGKNCSKLSETGLNCPDGTWLFGYGALAKTLKSSFCGLLQNPFREALRAKLGETMAATLLRRGHCGESPPKYPGDCESLHRSQK